MLNQFVELDVSIVTYAPFIPFDRDIIDDDDDEKNEESEELRKTINL